MSQPTPDPALYANAVQRIDPQATLNRVSALIGGVSAQTTLLDVTVADGSTQRWVLRLHGEADRAANPNIARDEFTLLTMLHDAGLPVPRPIAVDTAADLFPIPYIMVEYITGSIDIPTEHLQTCLMQAAHTLATIHQVNIAPELLAFLPPHTDVIRYFFDHMPEAVDESVDAPRLLNLVKQSALLHPRNPPNLLHGDYWRGNWVWQDARLVGVIDWEDAAFGDPISDLANVRLEVCATYGMDNARHFLTQYRAKMPHLDYSQLPYHDLFAALRIAAAMPRWGLDTATTRTMRDGIRTFVAAALKQIGA
jgi:aminoglycoside phosphotransferase (APT) family kinase protein